MKNYENAKELIKEIEIFADKIGKRKSETFDIVIDFFYQVSYKQSVDIELKKYDKPINDVAREIAKALFRNPFSNVLGHVHEELGGTNFNLGQFYTPSDLAEAVNDLTDKPPQDKPIRVADICCGSGSMILPKMKERDNANDYYFLVDKDETTLKMFLLHIWSSYLMSGKPMPWIEMVCGDGLFIQSPHKIVFSNTGRRFEEIDVIIRTWAYLDEDGEIIKKKNNTVSEEVEFWEERFKRIREKEGA